jgi:hypothetical protein
LHRASDSLLASLAPPIMKIRAIAAVLNFDSLLCAGAFNRS